MKKLIFILMLLYSSVAFAQIQEQHSVNNAGQTFIRLYNALPRPVSCYYRDNVNYFTFVIPPRSVSMWYPTYGPYQWQCN